MDLILRISIDLSSLKDSMGTSDYISIAAAALASILSIIAIFMSGFDHSMNKKAMTIEQYHRIADKDGPLNWFYHMSFEEYYKYYLMANERNITSPNRKKERDDYRTEKHERFNLLEDNLGKLDEFAAAINHRLYKKSTFNILAENYCKKRVVPRIHLILNGYNSENYKNLRKLNNKMNKERDYTVALEKEIEDYEKKQGIRSTLKKST